VAVERNGRWGTAIEVPGLAALNNYNAEVISVSCGAAGSCAAGGYYTDRRHHRQGFVAAERHGRWGPAIGVPGLAALNTGGRAGVSSVSCPSAGNCAAAGVYIDRRDQAGGFAVSQRNGHWTTAVYLPGLKPSTDVGVEVDSVSCVRAGGCAAVGTYGEAYGAGFVSVERHGRWGRAEYLILGGRFSGASSVSCAPAGNCAAGGSYSDDTGGIVQGAVVIGRHGRWGGQSDVPGLKALNKGKDAAVTTVTCPPAGRCVAGGVYLDRHGHFQAFVTT
jgi:hypothetical protein